MSLLVFNKPTGQDCKNNVMNRFSNIVHKPHKKYKSCWGNYHYYSTQCSKKSILLRSEIAEETTAVVTCKRCLKKG